MLAIHISTKATLSDRWAALMNITRRFVARILVNIAFINYLNLVVVHDDGGVLSREAIVGRGVELALLAGSMDLFLERRRCVIRGST